MCLAGIWALALKIPIPRRGLPEQAAGALAPLAVNGNEGLVFTTRYLGFSFKKQQMRGGDIQPSGVIADLRGPVEIFVRV